MKNFGLIGRAEQLSGYSNGSHICVIKRGRQGVSAVAVL
jgi:hypothetical protein